MEIKNLNKNCEELRNENEKILAEVMTFDPFLSSIEPIKVYDGDPSVSFSQWLERFKDVLGLITEPLTEEQKISRLRYCLSGMARAELDSVDPKPKSLEEACASLKAKFENETTKALARQVLSSCRQSYGEKVFKFAQRLNEAVRNALVGENETTIQKRLHEEFEERLLPDLRYEVKAKRVTNYLSAYDWAQHFELLLKDKSSLSQVMIADRPSTSGRSKQTCYYCKREGHFIGQCYDRIEMEESKRNKYRNREYYSSASSSENEDDERKEY